MRDRQFLKSDREPVAPGEESVWDYPRPPRLEQTGKRLEVKFNGVTIADSRRALRVLETSHPPVYYIPQADIRMQYLEPAQGTSYCEWKGQAIYYTVRARGKEAARAAWSYADPQPGFGEIAGHIAFYPAAMDACLVDGEPAIPQPGGFYGGWITREIKGPFKGGPGTLGW